MKKREMGKEKAVLISGGILGAGLLILVMSLVFRLSDLPAVSFPLFSLAQPVTGWKAPSKEETPSTSLTGGYLYYLTHTNTEALLRYLQEREALSPTPNAGKTTAF